MNEQVQEPLLFEDFPPVSSESWHETIIKDLKGADFDKKLIWKTYDGIAVNPYYRQEDLDDLPQMDTLPGCSPYIRGNRTTDNQWIIRQDINFIDPVKANQLARDMQKNGVGAIGFDASDLRTLKHLEELLAGIDLVNIGIHFTKAGSFPDLLDLFLEYLSKHHLEGTHLKGSFNYDPISCLLRFGKFHRNWGEHLDRLSSFIQKVHQNLPEFKAITVNAQLFHNAGSSLVQELGYGLAMANEYLAGLTTKGLSVDQISSSMMFSFAVGSEYFPEIAKLRSARGLWNRIVEQYHPSDECSTQMFIHSSTSSWNKTVFDPYVNILRTTTEIMSSALAGSAMISVSPFDQTFKDADDFSVRIARNQQIILQQESYLGKIADPGAGSYYIEKLTDEISQRSWDLFRKTESKGGFIECFIKHEVQDAIETISSQKITDIARRKMILLGTNQYPNLNEKMLDKLMIEADKKITLAEVARPLHLERGAEAIEQLRLATEKFSKDNSKTPAVFLLSMGNLAMRKARASFSSNFFGCGGYQIIDNPGFNSVEDGVRACLKVNPAITVICSSDEEYAEIVPAICKGLKDKAYPGIIILAGYPTEILDQMKASGIQDFIHMRTNLLESLKNFHLLLGITTL